MEIINQNFFTTYGETVAIDPRSISSKNRFLNKYDHFHADYLNKSEHNGIYYIYNMSSDDLIKYGLADLKGDIKNNNFVLSEAINKSNTFTEFYDYIAKIIDGGNINDTDNTINKVFKAKTNGNVYIPKDIQSPMTGVSLKDFIKKIANDKVSVSENRFWSCLLIVEGDIALGNLSQTIHMFPTKTVATRTIKLKTL